MIALENGHLEIVVEQFKIQEAVSRGCNGWLERGLHG